MRSWAADVFATSVAGSAYPWAAIVLRADPGAPLDQARVSLMFHTMELMRTPDSYYEPLRLAWQGAVASKFVLSEEQKAFVRRVKSRIGVDFKRWEEADDLADQLIGDHKPEEIANTLAIKDLRNILVAAWQHRIDLAQISLPTARRRNQPSGGGTGGNVTPRTSGTWPSGPGHLHRDHRPARARYRQCIARRREAAAGERA